MRRRVPTPRTAPLPARHRPVHQQWRGRTGTAMVPYQSCTRPRQWRARRPLPCCVTPRRSRDPMWVAPEARRSCARRTACTGRRFTAAAPSSGAPNAHLMPRRHALHLRRVFEGDPQRRHRGHHQRLGSPRPTQPSGSTAKLRGVSCPTDSTCFAVGDSATILATTDGGATWNPQTAPGGVSTLNAVSCADTMHCVAGA